MSQNKKIDWLKFYLLLIYNLNFQKKSPLSSLPQSLTKCRSFGGLDSVEYGIVFLIFLIFCFGCFLSQILYSTINSLYFILIFLYLIIRLKKLIINFLVNFDFQYYYFYSFGKYIIYEIIEINDKIECV